ncbi:MAG: hypothetical protein M1827_001001 [Pycnora praestabilis]|nr:MAG: hypothetical protein M1827_001001 [Pycnora praestabilis]
MVKGAKATNGRVEFELPLTLNGPLVSRVGPFQDGRIEVEPFLSSKGTLGIPDQEDDVLSVPYDDEWDFDFEDNRKFVAERWNSASDQYRMMITAADRETLLNFESSRTLSEDIQRRKSSANPHQAAQLAKILYVIRSYRAFVHLFIDIVKPEKVKTGVIWGFLHLIITLTLDSESRLARLVEVLSRFRRNLELFIRCVQNFEEKSEMRLEMGEALEALTGVLVGLAKYIRNHPAEIDDLTHWSSLQQTKIQPAGLVMDEAVKHLHEIAAFTKLKDDRQTSFVKRSNAGKLQMEDDANIFPCINLPFRPVDEFFGRQDVLQAIQRHLNWDLSTTLRTYTIYGRRGVGKTQIALEFAQQNTAKFEAIFWISCETPAALRQSFTDMALNLNLPGALKSGHHEENLLLCHNWLRKTERYWLLIFDNAENEEFLRGYWPASKGAILITSRKYVNFNNDAKRTGITVPLFTEEESWDVMVRLLNWKNKLDRGDIEAGEISAAKALLETISGLPLAIQQAATQIKRRGCTIQEYLEIFRHSSNELLPRPSGIRSSTIHALDTIWSIAFKALNPDPSALLSVLCLLSPDVIQLDLFLPKDQGILNTTLEFCKQDIGESGPRTLSTVVNASKALQDAIRELLDANLIRREGRVINVHRVVQEAFNYLSEEELQDAFNSAVHIVYEAFPKQVNGRPLVPHWQQCQRYVQDALTLAFNYRKLKRSKLFTLKSPRRLTRLLANCTWYLYEIGDHLENLKVLEIAFDTAETKDSLIYAHLRNTAGVSHFELNDLPQCRECLEIALDIRKRLLPPDHEELANTINNMGNLEAAEGQLEQALEYFREAERIRIKLGDDSAVSLATTYMTIGRTHLLQKDFAEAAKHFERSETLILRSMGPSSPSMAFLHYAYGNLERAQGKQSDAKRAYDQALKILLDQTPTHVLTSSTYYKLGCIEASLGNSDRAKSNLDKAYAIGDLRRSGLDDGNLARILWKKSSIVSDDPTDPGYEDGKAEQTRVQAELMRKEVERNVNLLQGEGITEEAMYDNLVCGYFR